MGANGNRRQTLRTNIIQPYESGMLADAGHKDYNAVMGIELDKISTATKHMFQGLDDVRKEVSERTRALDALHLQVNDQFNRVMMEIGGVKLQIGQGITMDNIVDADGNSLSGVLQGLKTQVNTANGQVMVAIGEITNLTNRFDGEILQVKADLKANHSLITSEVQRVTGVITTTANGLTQQIAKAETDIKNNLGGQITQTQQLITNINKNGTTHYSATWGVKSNVAGVTAGFGLANNGTAGTSFVVNAKNFIIKTGTTGVSPFVVSGNTVTMTQAIMDTLKVKSANITGTLTVASGNVTGDFKSADWDAKGTGWYLGRGSAATAGSGVLKIKSNSAGSYITLDAKGLTVYNGNTKRIVVGSW